MNYNGPNFIAISKAEIHQDYADNSYQDVSGTNMLNISGLSRIKYMYLLFFISKTIKFKLGINRELPHRQLKTYLVYSLHNKGAVDMWKLEDKNASFSYNIS